MHRCQLYQLRPVMQPRPLSQAINNAASQTAWIDKTFLIVDDQSPLLDALVGRLRRTGARVLVLQPVPTLRTAPVLEMASSEPKGLTQLVKRVRQIKGGLSGIVWLQTQPVIEPVIGPVQLMQQVLGDVECAIALAQAVAATPGSPLTTFYFVTAQAGHLGAGHEASVDMIAPALEALCCPLGLELPETSFRSINLDPAEPHEHQADHLIQELMQPDLPYRTAYGWCQGKRWGLGFQEMPKLPERSRVLNQDAVVVFAGGARGIGALCAQALAKQTRCHLIFLGRTVLTDEAIVLSQCSPVERQQQAEAFMQTYRAEHPTHPPRACRESWQARMRAVAVLETLSTIRAAGGSADYRSLDVRDRSGVAAILQQIETQYGRVDAVVHVAGLGGVDTDRRLSRKDWSVIKAVIDTKAVGASNLLAAAESVGAKLFLTFGSIASRFGNQGQVDYAAANGLLTGLVRAHNAQGRQPLAQVLAWGAWDGGGMALSGATQAMLQANGVSFIDPEEGAAAFVKVLEAALQGAVPTEFYMSARWPGLETLLVSSEAPLVEAEKDRSTGLGDTWSELQGEIVDSQPPDVLEAEHGLAPVAPSNQLQVSQPLALTSYLGELQSFQAGQRLVAHRYLDPQQEPLLYDHQFNQYVIVPGVYYLDLAVEAAQLLRPDCSGWALQTIHFHKVLSLVTQPKRLIIEADGEGDRQIQVRFFSEHQGKQQLHAEAQVVPAFLPLALPIGLSAPLRQARSRAGLYPHRFPHGQSFQVIEEMALLAEHRSRATLQITHPAPSGRWLPTTLLDGAFQVDSATRSGFEQPSGLPQKLGRLCWRPEVRRAERVLCYAQTADSRPDSPGEFWLVNDQAQVLLHGQGLTLTPSFSSQLPPRWRQPTL